MAGKGVVRSIKNYAKGFSDVQIKVREATSNDSWGPSGSLMNEIAQLTFNEQDFIEIMDMLDRRLNDKGKNWRHVFKALLVLDYCLHVGSENVVLYAKENIYVIRTLKEFQHIDDAGKDVGFNVRQKAKDITSLLMDEQRLKEERRSRHHMQDRMAGVGDYMNDVMFKGRNNDEVDVYRNPGYLDEDRDLKKAIEESKRLAEQESRRRGEGSDEDLQRAIRESEQEARELERKRREKLDNENQSNLFGNFITNEPSQQTFSPFPAQQSFDSLMNPYQQQQQFAQPTGMSFAEPIQHRHNPYQNNSQGFNASHLQAQMTGFQQIQTTAFQQPQATGFQQPQMTGFQQPQMTGFQQPQMTGYSSNPFGQSTSSSSFGTSNSQTMQASPSTPSNYSKLNAMLQNRDDGMDTFGNTGNLRIPYGTGFAATGALVSQNNNNSFSQPFAQQPSRNPFGNTTQPQQGQAQQKSMFEMMQQPQQQQMTGFPQMTGMQQQQQQQPQFTGQPSFL